MSAVSGEAADAAVTGAHAKPEPPAALVAARRSLDMVEGYAPVKDLAWASTHEVWTLEFTLTIDVRPQGSSPGLVPACTRWVALIAPEYPYGDIEVHPADEGGITRTFPHQSPNRPPAKGEGWWSGKLCLDTNVQLLGRAAYDVEPYDAPLRLRWRVERALAWLADAAVGRLLRPGDAFELPAFECTGGGVVAVRETPAELDAWRTAPQCGLVTLASIRGEKLPILVAREFTALKGESVRSVSWGTAITKEPETVTGVWVRLDGVPHRAPWAAPATWGDLLDALSGTSVDLLAVVRRAAPRLRDGKRHVLLVGFPIPAVVGEPDLQMHWQALRLPLLESARGKIKGFRNPEEGRWLRDRRKLQPGQFIEWMRTQNWAPEELTTRGRAPVAVRNPEIVLLGGGALGSALAELLVREGYRLTTVVDPDVLEAGNLVRHTLTIPSLRLPKALTLAERLNATSPHATVAPVVGGFPVSREARIAVGRAAVVIDCTGADAVLRALSQSVDANSGNALPTVGVAGPVERLFVSFSTSLGAERLFCFASRGVAFPADAFANALEPWLRLDLARFENERLPREGTGCWHPVAPGRASDITMWAAVAAKWLESVVAKPPSEPALTVFAQRQDDSAFAGAHKVELEEAETAKAERGEAH